MRFCFLIARLAASASHAGDSVDGKSYTNFGNDLVAPIFPRNAALQVFASKTDSRPAATIENQPAIQLDRDAQACVKPSLDGWARCRIGNVSGWVKRRDFLSADEYQPVTSWPFRYWLYVASSGAGSEESDLLRKAVRHVPYLIAPSDFENIFFHVIFDHEGRAINPRTGKPTGDRVFLVGKAAYLAPENPLKRVGARWLFLNYYHENLVALCPSPSAESCASAVNLEPTWAGIHGMYQQPTPQPVHKKGDEPWFGAQEVAFARHADPVRPLMYRVPNDVGMRVDSNPLSDAQRDKNREKLFCIADCTKR
jgi:hypothetical protein